MAEQRLERLIEMIRLIDKGRCPSPQALSERFEVAKRTVLLDIQLLKKQFGMKIVHDKFKGGYVNLDPKKGLPDFDLSDQELLVLLLGRDILSSKTSGALKPPAEAALEKIADRTQGGGKDMSAPLPVDFKSALTEPFQRSLLLELLKAVNTYHLVELEYYSPNSNEVTKRRVEPLIVREFNTVWYLVGWCRLRKELRQFALHRVRTFKVLNEEFLPRENLDLEKWLSQTFQVEHRHAPIKVKIRFEPKSARYLRERIWHAEQKMTDLPDSSLEMEFPSTSLEEVKRWLLYYGSSAVALEPPDLRKMMADELASSLQMYK